MASIDFTATHDGETYTRSSGTMPYVAISVGSQVMWHKTFAAAHAAAKGKYQTHRTGKVADVVPVTMVKFNGKVTAEWEETKVTGWGDIPAADMAALLDAKTETVETKVKETPAQARARQRAAKKLRDEEARIQAELDAQAAARATEVEPEPVEVATVEFDVTTAVLVKVEGKPQARRNQVDGTLVWRNSAKGRAARAAGIWV